MKTKIILFILAITTVGYSQIVNIPDANFKARLIELGIDSNNNGEIEVTEAQVPIGQLNCTNFNISDITGIEYFINVTMWSFGENNISTIHFSNLNSAVQHIDLHNNNLTSVYLDNLPNLEEINCGINPNLEEVTLKNLPSWDDHTFTFFNLNSPSLKRFYSDNVGIGILDFSNANELQEIVAKNSNFSFIKLSNSQVPSIDINVNFEGSTIVDLFLENNDLLDTLIVSNSNTLELLKYTGFNDIPLEHLVVNNLPNLEELELRTGHLDSLNLDKNENNLLSLKKININSGSGATNNLSYISLTNFDNLDYLSFSGENIINSTDYNIQNIHTAAYYLAHDETIQELDFSDINFTSNYIYILGCDSLNSIDFSNTAISGELRIAANDNLETLNLSNISTLSELKLLGNLELENIIFLNNTGLEEILFSSAGAGGSSTLALTSLDLTEVPNLVRLSLNRCNNLQEIDLSNQLYLQELEIYKTSVSNIDMSNLNNLLILKIDTNYYNSSNQPNPITLISPNDNNIQELSIVSSIINEINFSNWNELTKIVFNSLLLNDHNEIDLNNSPFLNYLSLFNIDNLEYLKFKNGIDEDNIYFSSNEDLKYVCCDASQIETVQNLVDVYGYDTCAVNTYCSFTPGGDYYTIKGQINFDLNNNGCDTNDLPVSFTSISTNNGNVFTNSNGEYEINIVENGTYTLNPQYELSDLWNIEPSSVDITFPNSENEVIQNFCLTANGTQCAYEVVIASILPLAPGLNSQLKVIYKNTGNVNLDGEVVLNYDDNLMEFVSATIVPNTNTNGELRWNFTDLLPFEQRVFLVTMNLNTPMDDPALNSGDTLCFEVDLDLSTDCSNDTLPPSEIFSMMQACFDVVNSYDPNDKTCLEGDMIALERIGDFVHYMIRFENIGTFPAVNVVIKDLIDTTKFDITTLVPIDGSHNFETKITGGNLVEFIFENIYLPFDDANNDGYVIFKIKTLSTLQLNDNFSNQAEIYFDYNYPIITNDYTTTIQNTLDIEEINFIDDFAIYPNPVKDILNFETEENVLKIEVFDIAGRILSSNSVTDNKIDLSRLKTGNYIIRLYTEKRIMSTKIMKE